LSVHSRLSPPQMVEAIFGGTPFASLFDIELPGPDPTVPQIEERHWYAHSLLLARTRMGKTNVIQWRIANLLPQVAAGKASVVLMEPKGVLTNGILNLVQTWNMRDRVVILDPADTPVAVNLFDKGDGSAQAIAETVGRVARVIGTLSSEFTAFQRDAITYATRAMFALPEPANIRTLTRILRGGKTVLPLDKLSESVRDYFEFDFQQSDGRYIISRLNNLRANPVFEALFTGERTTFDMLKEIQAGKLIVVNCSSRALGGDSKLYARFWIEEVERCVWPRLAMPAERRTPTSFIIDEAADYIGDDLHIAQLLDKAAESRIGMMFGMQHLAQDLDQRVKDSILTNTTLKFAANTSAEVHTLARSMGNTDAEFLSGLPLYEFAYHGPGLDTAIRVKFPLVDFDKMPKMTAEQYAVLRDTNSRRYSYVPQDADVGTSRTQRPVSSSHVYVHAFINTVPVHMLVDTGATSVVLSIADARRIGLDVSKLQFTGTGSGVGGTVPYAPVVLPSMRVDQIELPNVRASVIDTDKSLLGQSFLNRLERYHMQGDTLTMVGPQARNPGDPSKNTW
jgi:aspartyl protease family protein